RHHTSNIHKLFQCIYMIECLKDCTLSSYNNSLLQEYLENLSLQLMHFLYILPTGDDFFISSIIRLISETLLKIFYLSSAEKPIDKKDIDTIAHQDLWEKKIKVTNNYSNINYNNIIIEINNVFNKNSENMHAKNTSKLMSATYLEQFMKNGYVFDK